MHHYNNSNNMCSQPCRYKNLHHIMHRVYRIHASHVRILASLNFGRTKSHLFSFFLQDTYTLSLYIIGLTPQTYVFTH